MLKTADDDARDAPSLATNELLVLAGTFRLLGDPTRLRILLTLLNGQRSVGGIALGLALSPSLVSHHLRLLRAARLVRSERRARQVFYALADRHVSDMLRDMASHVAEEGWG